MDFPATEVASLTATFSFAYAIATYAQCVTRRQSEQMTSFLQRYEGVPMDEPLPMMCRANKGWTVGSAFYHPVLIASALLCCVGAVVLSFVLAPWWSSAIVIVCGIVGASVLIEVLKWRVQPVSLLGLTICIVLDILFLIR